MQAKVSARRIALKEKLQLFLPSLVASIVLIMIGQMIVPGFSSLNNISSILMTTGLLGIMTIAQNTAIMSGNNGIDLSVGAIASLTAVVCPMFVANSVGELITAFVIAALIGLLIGSFNSLGIQAMKIPPLIMTLIMGSVVDGAKLYVTRGQPTTSISAILQSVSNPIIQPFRVLTVCAIVMVIIAEIILNKSRFGKALLLTGDNPYAAAICGINTRLVSAFAYAISGAMAGIMGLFLAGYAGATTMSMGNSYTLLSVAAVAVGGTDLAGGKGSYISCLIGALVLTVLTTILQALNAQEGVRLIIKGVILIVIMVVNVFSYRNKN